ncbi:sulfotransferase family protein [Sphingomonas sp. BK036]|uniref:tetratricopeptide repeat-containing sulfotransferase family protein n=1 Tax=Sphingomonas sp. BK036 TaxID=2512122 RepID=UPI001029B92C|nr:sulfotransferase [Sphingomonas sp. BK036]RZT46304.1 sulfotransferase family protein [Sphingomonas sp. BK036]
MHRRSASFADLNAAFARRDRAVINDILEQWLDQDADVGDRWNVFAETLAQHGEWTLALRSMDRYLAVIPADLSRQFAQAVMLARAGRHDEAMRRAGALVAADPANVRFRHFAGTLALEAGVFDEARQHFLAVIATRSASAQTWLELSAMHRFTLGDALFDQLRHAANAAGRTVANAPLLYALGKALDDLGEVDDAFDAFSAGAALVAADRVYDPGLDRRQAAAMVHEWDGIALPSLDQTPSKAPILVTGLPRSGTTLVEQILASHPAIAGGAELNLLPIFARDAGGTGPDWIRARGHGNVPLTFADLYARLCAERFGDGARIVDKSLDIGRMLGFAAAVLPSAPIIWVRRQAIDAAWSCFRTYFARGVPWSWSLSSIAEHFTVEDQMFNFWQERLGTRLLVVEYEALVTHPRVIIPRIVAHAGLAHSSLTLAPHLARRHVLTSSVAQVRLPIHRNAINSAHPYTHRLGAFLEVYGAS